MMYSVHTTGTVANRRRELFADPGAQLAPHFAGHEFACKCCGRMLVDAALVDLLNRARVAAGSPIGVLSGYRCPAFNAQLENASPRSWHTAGLAVDAICPALPPPLFADLLARLAEPGYLRAILVYRSFVHLDRGTRP